MNKILLCLLVFWLCNGATLSAQLNVGCVDFYACNYDSDADIQVGDICEYEGYYGRTIEVFGNFILAESSAPRQSCSGIIPEDYILLDSDCVVATLNLTDGEWTDESWDHYELCLGINLDGAFIQGCMDEEACNYNPFATLELIGQCTYPVPSKYVPPHDWERDYIGFSFGFFGFENLGGCLFNPEPCEDSDDIPEIDLGPRVRLVCPGTPNYSPLSSPECYYQIVEAHGGTWSNEYYDEYLACAQNIGCTDENACNYNPNVNPAPDLDEVCTYPPENDICFDAIELNVNETYFFSNKNSCLENEGISLSVPSADDNGKNGWVNDQELQNDMYFFFNPPATGESLLITMSLADPSDNFDAQMAVFTGCEEELIKADDDSGLYNYPQIILNPDEYSSFNSYFIVIDGKFGDTGSAYLSIQTIDLEPQGNSCPGDFNGDESVNVSDLGGFLNAFGTTCEN